MKIFDYQLFAQKLLNNQLQDISNQKIFYFDINNILLELKKIQKSNFNLEYIVEKIIIDCSYYLPYVSLEFCKIYFFNQKIIYQAYLNIYKNFIYKQANNFLCTKYMQYLMNIFYNYVIIDNKIFSFQEQLNRNFQDYKIKYTNINRYIQYQLLLKEWNKLFLYLSYTYKQLPYQYKQQINCLDFLVKLYYQYIKIPNKYIINIIVNLIIHLLNNKYDIYIAIQYNEYNEYKKYNNYLIIFKLLLFNWDLIYATYKKIIKINIDNWYEWLQMNNYMNLDNFNILINQIKEKE